MLNASHHGTVGIQKELKDIAFDVKSLQFDFPKPSIKRKIRWHNKESVIEVQTICQWAGVVRKTERATLWVPYRIVVRVRRVERVRRAHQART